MSGADSGTGPPRGRLQDAAGAASRDGSLVTTVDLIRHGEPQGGRRYRGQQDDPLSERGWRQMWSAVGTHCPWKVIVASPLRRCAAFAGALAGRCGLPLEQEARFKEIGFGAWEGRTADELRAMDPQQLARFYADPVGARPPGAEPLEVFRERILAGWRELVERRAGRHVLVVGHAGVIRMVVSHVLDMPLGALFRLQVPYAATTRIALNGTGEACQPRLLFHAAAL